VIAERLSMDFVGFELVPCGNSSFIRVQRRPTAAEAQSSTAKVEELPLFGHFSFTIPLNSIFEKFFCF
jgi:hypothetical protein